MKKKRTREVGVSGQWYGGLLKFEEGEEEDLQRRSGRERGLLPKMEPMNAPTVAIIRKGDQ